MVLQHQAAERGAVLSVEILLDALGFVLRDVQKFSDIARMRPSIWGRGCCCADRACCRDRRSTLRFRRKRQGRGSVRRYGFYGQVHFHQYRPARLRLHRLKGSGRILAGPRISRPICDNAAGNGTRPGAFGKKAPSMLSGGPVHAVHSDSRGRGVACPRVRGTGFRRGDQIHGDAHRCGRGAANQLCRHGHC